MNILEYQAELSERSLETLTDKKSEDTEAIDGLILFGVDSKKGRSMEWIQLPKHIQEIVCE